MPASGMSAKLDSLHLAPACDMPTKLDNSKKERDEGGGRQREIQIEIYDRDHIYMTPPTRYPLKSWFASPSWYFRGHMVGMAPGMGIYLATNMFDQHISRGAARALGGASVMAHAREDELKRVFLIFG